MTDKELNEARIQLHTANARLTYLLEIFGDSLAKKHGWKNGHRGLEAVYFFLMERHHWTPAQVRSMSHEDLRFAMSEEIAAWTAPKGIPLPGY